ncbi:Elongator complex protein 5 [Cyphellophora attinorum]|uniref:Elongator complex protein 5 n=1 Tax=Cyphellophora attinorum TaxID=1664694 RepID=A0A0N1H024_9EURO|nr:Elongator complex protein 5 [Phialophora attinorum]KPI36897.1 Elongator complex protein 5 [Phialophora attinorum]
MNNLSHRRTHNLLLISKLLNQRDHASPFTLVLDSLEQPAKPLLREYLRRAKIGKSFSIYLAFETIRKPGDADLYVTCWDKTPVQISNAVSAAMSSADAGGRRCLILIDSCTALAALATDPTADFNLTSFLSSLLQPPAKTTSPPAGVSVVAVYHQDVPQTATVYYVPSPLELLSYLATTMIHVHSLAILVTEKEARERSVVAPSFGLDENVEGIVIGLKKGSNSLKPEHRGLVLELEHRRNSGRGVHEWYFLPRVLPKMTAATFKEVVSILDDHPAFQKASLDVADSNDDLTDMTFSLGLTDRQRQDREGVVLPYFDAQNPKPSSGVDGGRILYDMGAEDDFDDEEDEI